MLRFLLGDNQGYQATLDKFIDLNEEVEQLRKKDNTVKFVDPVTTEEAFSTSDSIDDFIKKL